MKQKKISEKINRAGMKNIILVSGVKCIGLVCTLLSIVLLTKLLTPAGFGRFTICIALMTIGFEFAGQGIDLGTVKFSSSIIDRDKEKAGAFFSAALILRITLSSLLFFSICFFSKRLSNLIFHTNTMSTEIILVFVAVIIISIAKFTQTVLQAEQKFGKLALVELTNAVPRLLLIIILFITKFSSVSAIITSYIIAGLLSSAIGALFTSGAFSFNRKKIISSAKKLITYSKWVVASCLLMILYSRLDIIMLGYFEKETEAGYFSVAQNFITSFDVIIFSVITVLLPKVSKFNQMDDYEKYIKQTLKYIFVSFPLLILIFFLSKPFITTIFGSDYLLTVKVFNIMYAGFLLTLIVYPLAITLYALNLPHYLTVVDFFIFITNFAGNMIFIPKYGATGAAWVTFSTKLAIMTAASFIIYLKVFRISANYSLGTVTK